jgi:predicted DNA-binding transcriptional regulator AlpA
VSKNLRRLHFDIDDPINKDISTISKGDCMNKIKLIGRQYEDIKSLRARLRVGENAIYNALKNGMPSPIKIGGRRYFDSELVDQWLVKQVTVSTSPPT